MERRDFLISLPVAAAGIAMASGAIAQTGVHASQAKHDDDPSGIDPTLRLIGEYIANTRYESFPPASHGKMVRHITDTIGCAIGGYAGPPSAATRKLAASAATADGVTVYGQKGRFALQEASFANGCMARYLDTNDMFLGNSGGHVSDMVPAILALGESLGSSGKDIILACQVGYEMYAALCETTKIRDHGWDYGYAITFAAATSLAKLLNLTAEQAGNAIALAVTPSIPLGATRVGELSQWKGMAGPWAASSALWAARLAKLDVTGPPWAIQGHRGVWDLATGQFDLSLIGKPIGGKTAVERASYKLYVAEYNSQSVSQSFIRLYNEGLRAKDIKSISIGTYFLASSEIGDKRKWDPKNKETADHSMPFILAAILRDGKITRESYEPKSVLDPALRPVMNKISVHEDAGATARFPERLDAIVDITLNNGKTIHFITDYPPGHPKNELTDAQLVGKFRDLANGIISPAKANRYLEQWIALESVADVRPLLADLADFG